MKSYWPCATVDDGPVELGVGAVDPGTAVVTVVGTAVGAVAVGVVVVGAVGGALDVDSAAVGAVDGRTVSAVEPELPQALARTATATRIGSAVERRNGTRSP
ncbi:MAG: hypothetical protein AAFY28_04935 [Actinomycetota bacterium]